MTQTELTYLFNHPSQISENHLEEISEILDAFPYFQAPRVIQLKGLKNTNSFKYNDALKRTAAHTIDRSVLFNFITNFSMDKETPTEVILEQIEVIDPITIEAKNISVQSEELLEQKSQEKSPEEILEIGKPIQFQKHEPHSFNEWMQLISKKPIKRTPTSVNTVSKPNSEISKKVSKPEDDTTIIKQNKSSKKTGHLNLIDKFIESNPKIKPVKKSIEIKDVSKGSSEQNESLMTETLAKVYVEQKKYDNAIQAYRILSLKYPEKSVFFADRIKAITILQRNKS